MLFLLFWNAVFGPGGNRQLGAAKIANLGSIEKAITFSNNFFWMSCYCKRFLLLLNLAFIYLVY